MMYSAYGMGELAAAPLDMSYAPAVTAMHFSPHYEALWAGTDSGHLYTVHCPGLQPYAHWQAHVSGPVLEMLAVGDGVMSLSQHRLALHGLGGAPRWCLNDPGGSFTALCLEGGDNSGHGARAVLGRSNHTVSLVDMPTGKVALEQDVMGLLGGEGVTLLRGPVSRGSLVCATSLGRLTLIDPRGKLRADSALIAAPGGIVALDARGDTVAAAGYGVRAGQMVVENCVKIYDIRAGLRLLYSLPTAGSPSSLVFHPLLPTSLLVAMPSALFCLADTSTGAATNMCQADMASDSLSAATVSSSGELVALGGSGGYVHIWGDVALGGPGEGRSGRHKVNKAVTSVAAPTPGQARPKPLVVLQEEDSFFSAPQYPSGPLPGAPPGSLPAPLASDWDGSETSAVGLPPRMLDPAVRREMRMVDGVGYLPNPYYSRSKSLWDMIRDLAGQRHGPSARMSMRHEWVDPTVARAERQRQRAAEGGVVLPLRYRYVEIRHYGRLKWEEFDFSYYNRTRFAGLENDLPNAYCNALLQILYFTPEFRSLALAHIPEPDVEFCLTCELSFLFAMLQCSGGLPCQATNLLRTLRSLREAAALGLLDGGGIGPATGTGGGPDAGLAAAGLGSGGAVGGSSAGSSETELSRRVAALSRFVLEQMHSEASNARNPSMGPFRSGIAPQPAPANAALAPALEALMAVSFRQRMTTLAGPQGPDSVREARTFQVDLQYPPSREKAARAAEEARQLGLNRLPVLTPLMQDTPGGGPPTFAELLSLSLLAISTTRAWLDEARGYALVRKMRVPLSLPPLLTVNVAVGDSEEAAWWLPGRGPAGVVPAGEANRLPLAIAVVSKPQTWEVEVHQADTAEQLYTQLGVSLFVPGVVSCVYELCGAVFQIRDLDEASDPSSNRGGSKLHQGHLVAMIKVPQQYWDELPSSRLPKPLQGSMAEFVKGGHQLPEVAATTTASGRPQAAAVGTAATVVGVRTAKTNGCGGGAPATGDPLPSQPAGTSASAEKGGGGAGSKSGGVSASIGLGTSHGTISLPDDLDDIFAFSSETETRAASTPSDVSASGPGPDANSLTSTPGATKVVAGAGASRRVMSSAHASSLGSAASVAVPACGGSSRPLSGGSAGLRSSHSHSFSVHGSRGHPQGPEWVLFNDFSVFPNCPAHEVTATYANQKLPCLLQYRQVPPPPHLVAAAAKVTAAPTAATGTTPGSCSSGAGGGPESSGKRHSGPQRSAPAGASASPQPPQTLTALATASASPMLTAEQFRVLCCSHPLQGLTAGLPPFRFRPLDLGRVAPRPGMRFAIDAEFVASTPPESRAVERQPGAGGMGCGSMNLAAGGCPGALLPHHFQGGVGGSELQQPPQQPHYHAHGGGMDLVQFKQSRLTLARVAVVVAEPGPLAGSCCLDDYVRAVEPVYDYLTRWSGIQPGDLDPSVSRHYTTTLKHTYLKLKYLLDCGCVFVGHDLRKDFRCINMVVPPEQVIDTSELFRHRGGRKLSLRFLASYLLGVTLQGATGPVPLPQPHQHSPSAAAGAAAAAVGPHQHLHMHPHGSGPIMGPMGGPPHAVGPIMTHQAFTSTSFMPQSQFSFGAVSSSSAQLSDPHAQQQQQQQQPGHDAVEDARMAMRLYHKYLELVANDSFTQILNEMYAWGKKHGWDPANTANMTASRRAGGSAPAQPSGQ